MGQVKVNPSLGVRITEEKEKFGKNSHFHYFQLFEQKAPLLNMGQHLQFMINYLNIFTYTSFHILTLEEYFFLAVFLNESGLMLEKQQS